MVKPARFVRVCAAVWAAALGAVAFADEPGAIETYVEDGEVVHRIQVYGDMLVEEARQEVIRGFAEEGYTEVVDKGDYVRLRSPEVWKGEIRVYDDGWIHMRRQPVQVVGPEVPWAKKNSALAYASCVLYPLACVKTGGQLLSRRKMLQVKERALAPMQPEMTEFSDLVADRATEEAVNGLPERLEALWNEGVPLAEGPPLETPEARREALLEFWNSRTDTVWGDRVRLAVEAFIRAEVQTGEHPFAPEEIRAFNERRTCTRVLDLERPWEDVMAEVDPAW